MLLSNFREQARLNRGIFLATPVFWASFSVFLDAVYGIAGFTIHFFLCPPRKKTGRLFQVLALVINGRIMEMFTQRGETAGDLLYQKGGVSLFVLGPDSSLDSASDNNHSLVCLLKTKHEKALFTGDIEGPAQLALASTWPLWRNAWLKAPHHGSDRTTLPCFLTAASASRVAISSRHRPGFPGRTTLETFGNLHTKVSVTTRTGAITWEFGRDTAQCRNFRGML